MLSDLGDLPAIKLTENDWLRFETDSLTSYGREVAQRELRESPEVAKEAKEKLRKLLQGIYALECASVWMRVCVCALSGANRLRAKAIDQF